MSIYSWRNLSRKKIFIITLSFIIGFSIIIYLNPIDYQYPSNENLKFDDQNNLKRAGFWEIEPIEINDSDPTKDWAITEATYDWCIGSGTINDPYVISNITINLGGAEGNCIEIINSNAHFIIKNCLLYNASGGASNAGINLDNVNNGKILNNSIMHVSSGVYLSNSDNIEIDNNQINETVFCIRGFVGNFLNISKNFVQDGELRLTSISSSIIIENDLQNSYLAFDQYCDNNIMLNNIINSTYKFVNSISLLRSKNATIRYNNLFGGGISLMGTYEDIATHIIDKSNSVNNKTLYYYKKIEGLNSNNFTNPGQIVLVDCYNSFISDINISECGSSSILGYWCKNITFSNNLLIDYYPRRGFVRPGHGFDLCDCTNITIFNNTLRNKKYGIVLYRCNSTRIVENNITHNYGRGVYLLKANSIKIVRNRIHNNQDVGVYLEGCINCSVLYNNISNSRFGIVLNKFSNTQSNFNIIFNNTIFNNVEVGVVLIGAYANLFYMNRFIENKINAEDYASNWWDNGSIGNYWDDYNGFDCDGDNIGETVYRAFSYIFDHYPICYRFDNISPVISVIKPSNNSVFELVPPNFKISIQEYLLDSTWYRIEGVGGNFSFTDSNFALDQQTWDDLPEGDLMISIYAEDRAGNIGTEAIKIIKRIFVPNPPENPAIPAISGFNLFFLFIILSVVIIFINKRIKNS